MPKVWVGDILVPPTRAAAAADDANWHSVGTQMSFRGALKGMKVYKADCGKGNVQDGDLCDAYRRPTGEAEASYCSGGQCAKGYVSRRTTAETDVRVEPE